MIATSKHNKYVSIPDWFGSSSNESTTSETAASTTTVVISGGGNTGGISGGGGGSTEIPIDNRTIVWSNSLLTVPIDDDKIIVKDGKITTSTTSGLWELREASDGSSYIYTTYPVATQQGITMYVDNNDLDLPSIYDGLPIDNVTIYWALDDNGNKVLKSIGQSGGGVADRVAWVNITGKPSWLLDDKIQYTEIEGTPDLSGFITKAYVDDNFVTFSLNEEISGIKSFTNGLKIGESLIKQLQNDVVYIDANLVVRGGVTMYYDDGEIDIPNIQDQIGSAGYNEKGLASFDQTYFTINDGHVSLIEDAVGLNEDELLNYLTNNKYATQSWVETRGYALNSDLTTLSTKVNDFLEGSDTDNIINKWKELEAFLTGLDGSNDLATILSWKADKTYVDETFVTIGGDTEQTITGPKNFTGGLKVNGSPIYYDPEKKYWKLEGDLLVTGGVTMYGNDSEFTPSTIMDAIAVDGTTVSKEGGILKVIGSVGGATTLGGLANVGSWADSVASQDRIMYQAANSSQWVAKNLSDLTVGGVTGNYLPLSGGTLTGDIFFVSSNAGGAINSVFPCHYYHRFWANNDVYVHFYESSSNAGELNSVANLRVATTESSLFKALKFSGDGTFTWADNKIWHAGNDGSGSGLDADLLDGKHYSDIINGNVASATKLQTDRTIWGQRFDGTGNVDGNLVINASTTYPIRIIQSYSSAWASAFLATNSSLTAGQHYNIDFGHSVSAYNAAWVGYYHAGVGSTSNRLSMGLNSVDDVINILGTGNVGIGTTSPAYKLDVSGTFRCTAEAYTNSHRVLGGNGGVWLYGGIRSGEALSIETIAADGTWLNRGITILQNGNVGINTITPSVKLSVVGDVNVEKPSTTNQASLSFMNTSSDLWQISGRFNKNVSTDNNRLNFYYYNGTTWKKVMELDTSNNMSVTGNILAGGGVTMYSDARKKTILNHVELSLKEIAEAPLIEHYYNSDEKKTTHVGSIAQYWAGLNDWFCKLDNEGYYTMEIQNAALASAISVARELVKFETETDRRIRLLEEENEQLKKEIEILKWNIA